MHVYWFSERPLPPDEWLPYANGLKALVIKHGLKCDAGLTTDAARVLRIPGTQNFKTMPPRPVKLLAPMGKDYDFSADLSELPTHQTISQRAVALVQRPDKWCDPALFPKQAWNFPEPPPQPEHTELPPLKIMPIAQQCAFINKAILTGGKDYDQPQWNLTTLCATFMEHGHTLAHRMGNKHPGYTHESTEELWDRKSRERLEKGIGWPSCQAIQAAGCKACATCPHLGKIKSPLNLAKQAAKQISDADKKIPENAGNDKWPDGCRFGTPVKGYANTLASFHELGIQFIYDTFRHKEFTSGHAIAMLNGELSDRTVTMLRDQIRSKCGFYPDKETVREAITAECLRNLVNPVTDYFDRLRWDGIPRLSRFLHKYLGAEDTPLNAAIGTKFFCAIVRRAKQPGCKFDHQVVLQSGQGFRKSMFCEDLAVFSDLFTDAGEFGGSIKEFMEVAQGKQIIEFAEMAGHSQGEREKAKSMLSRRKDRARMAYAHYASEQPRSSVPIGTINCGGYLNDPTGERRYWHVAVTKYDREAFLTDKDQLYAEAVAREPNEKLWLDTPELVRDHDAIVTTAKEPNALVDELAQLAGEMWEIGREKIGGVWVIHREERISNKEVRGHLGIFGVDTLRIRDLGKRISEAMMTLGWQKADGTLVCKRGGKAEGGYRRPMQDTHEVVTAPLLLSSPAIPSNYEREVAPSADDARMAGPPNTAPDSATLVPEQSRALENVGGFAASDKLMNLGAQPSTTLHHTSERFIGINKGPEPYEPTEPSK